VLSGGCDVMGQQTTRRPAIVVLTERWRVTMLAARRPEATQESMTSPSWRSQTPIDPDREPGRGRDPG
jgi:hypothetical protein